ncbi:hypothetical protein BBK36DRAFT_1170355 [Trichoderma citrinoviride]|uniref:Uncharacterized protein n=1 Tax=Trichoderma citrinoviride TaxID=58853 RepID=A0A2T4B636_9HYPO|nr:hypothetical protein BBK36DRAFT_1170355 [Trichoderma citrinoviride]PTB64671.1 hypothetical protein BBK36DRAFT_1170355 [Trichoderma citrinoviride]
MSLAALLIPVLASGVHVAAQHMTLPLINYGEVVNALNPTDSGYQFCTVAASFVSGCIAEVGGSEALSTANPLKLAACACCVGTTDVAPVYSTCADYLSSEAPQLGSQISAYDYLYTVCGGSPEVCRGQAGATATGEPPKTSAASQSSRIQSLPSKSTPSPASTPSSSVPAETSRVTAEGSTVESTRASSATGASGSAASRTASGTTNTSPVITLASACIQMVGIFQECTSATPSFTDLPFGEQAYCYCCRTALDGHVTWTDEIETYASTCLDWAATAGKGEPETASNVAKTMATFCDHFSDVCTISSTTTAPSSSTATDDSSFPPPDATGDSTASGGPATVTVTRAATTTTSGNAAPTARVGLAAGVLAIAGFVAMV